MQFFSQSDPRFKTAFMGKTRHTIGQDGCTITDLGMIAGLDPVAMNKMLTRGGGYAFGNLVNWTMLQKCVPSLKFIYRYKKYDNKVALAAIKKYGFCLAEVDYDGNTRTQGNHWVVLLGNHLMNDPLSLSTHPESTSKYRLYTGLAVIQKV